MNDFQYNYEKSLKKGEKIVNDNVNTTDTRIHEFQNFLLPPVSMDSHGKQYHLVDSIGYLNEQGEVYPQKNLQKELSVLDFRK